jgi:hypothetical protein
LPKRRRDPAAPDFLDIVRRARSLLFNVTLKTNGVLLAERDAECLAGLAVSEVHISIYSHKPEVHDAITRLCVFRRSRSRFRSDDDRHSGVMAITIGAKRRWLVL